MAYQSCSLCSDARERTNEQALTLNGCCKNPAYDIPRASAFKFYLVATRLRIALGFSRIPIAESISLCAMRIASFGKTNARSGYSTAFYYYYYIAYIYYIINIENTIPIVNFAKQRKTLSFAKERELILAKDQEASDLLFALRFRVIVILCLSAYLRAFLCFPRTRFAALISSRYYSRSTLRSSLLENRNMYICISNRECNRLRYETVRIPR